MSQYVVDSSRAARNTQHLLMAVPLAITMIFSFCFVALHSTQQHAVSASSGKTATADSGSAKSLPPISMSQASAQTLSPLEEETTSSSPNGNVAASPTAVSSSSIATTSPQSAVAAPSTPQTAAQAKKNASAITVPVIKTVNKLLH